MKNGHKLEFRLVDDDVLWLEQRLCVAKKDELKEEIMKEANESSYNVHSSSTKMYRDLKKILWWKNIKNDITAFLSRYLVCQQVKIEHQRPGGLLQFLPIL